MLLPSDNRREGKGTACARTLEDRICSRAVSRSPIQLEHAADDLKCEGGRLTDWLEGRAGAGRGACAGDLRARSGRRANALDGRQVRQKLDLCLHLARIDIERCQVAGRNAQHPEAQALRDRVDGVRRHARGELHVKDGGCGCGWRLKRLSYGINRADPDRRRYRGLPG